jgi:hypothetical protein
MTKINSPFTDEQVTSINGSQKSGHWHPFTCGKEGCQGILIAQHEGLFCPDCHGWFQRWVHDFMADGEWKRLDELSEAAEKGIDEFSRVLYKGRE